MIKQIQKEQNEVEIEIEKSIRGESAPTKRNEDEQRESRLQHVIANRNNMTILDFFRTSLITLHLKYWGVILKTF